MKYTSSPRSHLLTLAPINAHILVYSDMQTIYIQLQRETPSDSPVYLLSRKRVERDGVESYAFYAVSLMVLGCL